LIFGSIGTFWISLFVFSFVFKVSILVGVFHILVLDVVTYTSLFFLFSSLFTVDIILWHVNRQIGKFYKKLRGESEKKKKEFSMMGMTSVHRSSLPKYTGYAFSEESGKTVELSNKIGLALLKKIDAMKKLENE